MTHSTPDQNDAALLEQCVIVGGCGALLFVSAEQQANFYRGQGCIAILGTACLLGFFLVSYLL